MSGAISVGSRVVRSRKHRRAAPQLQEFEISLAGVDIEYATAVPHEQDNYIKEQIELTTYTVSGRRSSISSVVSEDEEDKLKAGPQLSTVQYWKKRIFTLFDEPQSSMTAMFIAGWIMLLILMSTVTFCMESLPSTRTSRHPGDVWDVLETIAVAHFTIEYVVRLLTCDKVGRFVISPLNMVDLLAILPFYIELTVNAVGGEAGVGGLAVIRVIRLARVFRIFKFSKYSTGFVLVGRAMKKSTDALYLMVFLVGIAMIVFSSGIYFGEQTGSVWDPTAGAYGSYVYIEPFGEREITPYNSIPETFWFTLVTLTTVGYGEISVLTPTGKIITGIAMMCGVVIIAFPITIIGTNFDETWTENKQQTKQKQLLRERKLLEFEKSVRAEDLDEHKKEKLQDEIMTARISRLMNYKVDADNRTDDILDFLESTTIAFNDMKIVIPMYTDAIKSK
eukprot:TRINITY_DN2418_c0_g1_i1.p1 TRINITY_DN2418_c0_g1~~TRINITY_DN2418_c0_g1_i1.p1  ORF type:complete len:461 (-),score=118.25 TRINITY_DN2418_c0_g1_i1:1429-2775(-)